MPQVLLARYAFCSVSPTNIEERATLSPKGLLVREVLLEGSLLSPCGSWT